MSRTLGNAISKWLVGRECRCFIQLQMLALLFGWDTDRISFFCEYKAVIEWTGTDSVRGNKAETAQKIFYCQFRHFTTSSWNLHHNVEQETIQQQRNKCPLKNTHLPTYRLCCTSWDTVLYSNPTLWLIMAYCNPLSYILFRLENKAGHL